MCAVIIKRTCNFQKVRDPDDFGRRRAKCSAFRLRMKKLHLTATAFARLIGVSDETVYTWRSHTQRCIPPHPTALLILSLIELRPDIISTLEELASSEGASIRLGEERS
jgi:DNA-binding transcriptional regulator YdaS (Cro superfamily)